MSEAILELNAAERNDLGKSASRRLRRVQEQIPAIIYGGNSAPTPIYLDHKKILQAIEHEAFFSQIISVNLTNQNNKSQLVKVILKDIQRHPYKAEVLHMDFQRISANQTLMVKVPVHFTNESTCPGVKAGGILNHLVNELEVKCQATKIPEFIEVNLSNLALDEAIHISQITLPSNVELTAAALHNDRAIINVHLPRAAKIESEEQTTPVADDDNKDKEQK